MAVSHPYRAQRSGSRAAASNVYSIFPEKESAAMNPGLGSSCFWSPNTQHWHAVDESCDPLLLHNPNDIVLYLTTSKVSLVTLGPRIVCVLFVLVVARATEAEPFFCIFQDGSTSSMSTLASSPFPLPISFQSRLLLPFIHLGHRLHPSSLVEITLRIVFFPSLPKSILFSTRIIKRLYRTAIVSSQRFPILAVQEPHLYRLRRTLNHKQLQP